MYISLALRTPYVVVHITRKFWFPNFCGSYAPLNLRISRKFTTEAACQGKALYQLVEHSNVECKYDLGTSVYE
jgi:hypothetical protein